MKAKVCVLLLVFCYTLTACTSENSQSGSISDSSSSRSSSTAQDTISSSSENREETFGEISKSSVISEDCKERKFEDFSLYIPDKVYLSDDEFMVWNILVEDNIIYDKGTQCDSSESPSVLAKVFPSEKIIDIKAPFESYDKKYKDAERIEEMVLGLFEGKFYYLQEESEWGYVNTFVYCINLGDKMAIIEYYPSRGWGGFRRQSDAFEILLNTITTTD